MGYQDRVKAIGFSGHHLGIAIDVAAYALGAQWIERHFTKDQSWKGTDHAASLDAAGLTRLCRNLKEAWESMTYKSEDILPLEQEQRKKFKWGEYNNVQVNKVDMTDEIESSVKAAVGRTVSVGGQ